MVKEGPPKKQKTLEDQSSNGLEPGILWLTVIRSTD